MGSQLDGLAEALINCVQKQKRNVLPVHMLWVSHQGPRQGWLADSLLPITCDRKQWLMCSS